MQREHYVRPPLVAHEPASARVVLWRVRLVAVLAVIVGTAALLWLFLTFSGVTNGENPGFGALAPLLLS